tara:strand:+ start:1584 stop:1868 length:285 start_codon:yes stop_codon:yes gene_type:complete
MLKHGEVNPINVHGLRRLEHWPPHFERVVFDIRTSQKSISDWIYENLEGRFWIGDTYNTTGGGSTSLNKCAAFEKHSEASYFSLVLDTINKSEW